ncbi:hypothetical protein E3P77_00241 [Wallemia ichthyophaga]|nr:hypothetical protein E3P77_00241 [Wallemia ichthyophaga]
MSASDIVTSEFTYTVTSGTSEYTSVDKSVEAARTHTLHTSQHLHPAHSRRFRLIKFWISSLQLQKSGESLLSSLRCTKMGAYKYVQSINQHKQSDLVKFRLRVMAWYLRQLTVISRAPGPSNLVRARQLGYKRKQGYVIYRVRVRRGNRKRPCPKGVTNGKPVRQGINHLKPSRGHRALAEERVGRRCSNLRVLNSYWINQDGVYKFYEVILVDPSHKAIRRDARINWICDAVHKHRESRGLTAEGKKNRGLGKGHRFNKTPRRATWRRNNTLSLTRYR